VQALTLPSSQNGYLGHFTVNRFSNLVFLFERSFLCLFLAFCGRKGPKNRPPCPVKQRDSAESNVFAGVVIAACLWLQ